MNKNGIIDVVPALISIVLIGCAVLLIETTYRVAVGSFEHIMGYIPAVSLIIGSIVIIYFSYIGIDKESEEGRK